MLFNKRNTYKLFQIVEKILEIVLIQTSLKKYLGDNISRKGARLWDYLVGSFKEMTNYLLCCKIY